MPKATATCTCRHCGKTFYKDLFESGKGASRHLEEKVHWAENGGIDECPDCWKNRQRAEEKAAGLTCTIRLSSIYDDAPSVYAIFGGDSYSHKDELKAAGCRWTDAYPADTVIADMLGMTRQPKAWVMTSTDADELIAAAQKLGAPVALPDNMDLDTWAAARAEVLRIREKEQAERQSTTAAALETLGPIPAWPESIKVKWPAGATWNGKIYGKPGARNIYLSGQRISLTDDEANKMESVQRARAQWRKKKAEIEKNA